MSKFVAIIGERNSGKSTIIKSLTGYPKATGRGEIVDNATGQSVYVICASPQESRIEEMNEVEFERILKKEIKNSMCNGVVCALQPTNPSKKMDLEKACLLALKHGYTVSAFIVDPGYKGKAVGASAIQARLKKIGLTASVLDGRRFAHLNAVAVNRRSKIIF